MIFSFNLQFSLLCLCVSYKPALKHHIKGCSQIKSAKNGGPDPLPPFVSQCQHFPDPTHNFVSHCQHFPPSIAASVLSSYSIPPSPWMTKFDESNYIIFQRVFSLRFLHNRQGRANTNSVGSIQNRLWILGRPIQNCLCTLGGPIQKPIGNKCKSE